VELICVRAVNFGDVCGVFGDVGGVHGVAFLLVSNECSTPDTVSATDSKTYLGNSLVT
jgi:hypothetical protein